MHSSDVYWALPLYSTGADPGQSTRKDRMDVILALEEIWFWTWLTNYNKWLWIVVSDSIQMKVTVQNDAVPKQETMWGSTPVSPLYSRLWHLVHSPHTEQLSNTSWAPYHSIQLWYWLELAQTTQIKGSAPRDGSPLQMPMASNATQVTHNF